MLDFNHKKFALLITDRKTRKYLTDFDVAEGYVVKMDNEVVCFTDARYFSAVKPLCEKHGVKAQLFSGLDCIKDYLVNQGVEGLYVDYTKETVSDYLEYEKWGIGLKDGSSIIKNLRSVKKDDEIEYIKKACEIAEKAYHTAIKKVKKGITEKWLKDEIENLMLSMGADGIAFDTIVAFGANAAVPHHQTGDTVLNDNTAILVDTGCTVNGYCSDITRMAYYGTPTEKFNQSYLAVLKANVLAEEQIRSGMSGKQADGIAREYLKSQGLDGYFTHSLGHGIGLDIHEYPTLSPKKDDELKDGMVFSIEPGVYVDGELGIRIEDTVMLKDGKVERLFTDDKKLIII